MAVGGKYIIILRWKMFGIIPRKICFANEEWKTWDIAYHVADMLRDLGSVEVRQI